jgi:hypothetical protein
MADEPKSAYVTRGDLYTILGNVYMLIALALLAAIRANEGQILLVIGHFLLFLVAIGSSITFGILGRRERRREKKLAARSTGPDPALVRSADAITRQPNAG